jgi:hypothetical protein
MSKETEKKADEQQENITPASSDDEQNQTTNASGTDGDGAAGDGSSDEGTGTSENNETGTSGSENEPGGDGTSESTSGDEESEPDDDEEAEEKEEAKVLVATAYILYNSKQYAPGDELPANDEGMVKAWVEAKTAAWINESTVRAKARPVTALPGAVGDAIHSEAEDGENLIGRVPKTSKRRRK